MSEPARNNLEVADLAEQLLQRLKSPPIPLTPEQEAEMVRQREEEEQRWREESNREFCRKRLANTVPPNLVDLTASPIQTPALSAAKAWLTSEHRGLMIRGGIGVGKSAAAACVVKDLIESNKMDVTWLRPNELVSAVLHSYDEDSPRLGRDLLVVDDVGRETKPDFVEALCAFIDECGTRFILTTNLQREEFRTRYDPRLIDRLNDCAKAVSIKGDSMRRKDGGF